jgi:hypothetical protein
MPRTTKKDVVTAYGTWQKYKNKNFDRKKASPELKRAVTVTPKQQRVIDERRQAYGDYLKRRREYNKTHKRPYASEWNPK